MDIQPYIDMLNSADTVVLGAIMLIAYIVYKVGKPYIDKMVPTSTEDKSE